MMALLGPLWSNIVYDVTHTVVLYTTAPPKTRENLDGEHRKMRCAATELRFDCVCLGIVFAAWVGDRRGLDVVVG